MVWAPSVVFWGPGAALSSSFRVLPALALALAPAQAAPFETCPRDGLTWTKDLRSVPLVEAVVPWVEPHRAVEGLWVNHDAETDRALRGFPPWGGWGGPDAGRCAAARTVGRREEVPR